MILLMAVRTARDGSTESEPVLVEVVAGELALMLDDGSSLTFDRLELVSALQTRIQEAA